MNLSKNATKVAAESKATNRHWFGGAGILFLFGLSLIGVGSYIDFPPPPDPMLKPVPQIPDTRGPYDSDDPNDCWVDLCDQFEI